MAERADTRYPRLPSLLGRIRDGDGEEIFSREVLPYLAEIWLDEYDRSTPRNDVVQVTLESGFSYLFDVLAGRLIAAWGIGRGKHTGARPKSRMAGHPLSAGPRYHRGHAIPHTLGGGTDINLVAQLGSVNVGPFRPLERKAVGTPGSMYYTYWIYSNRQSQTPTSVEQGLFVPGGRPSIVLHGN